MEGRMDERTNERTNERPKKTMLLQSTDEKINRQYTGHVHGDPVQFNAKVSGVAAAGRE